MFKSIYKKIAEDFAFLGDYDYRFEHDLPHHVRPSVVFRNSESKLQIGYGHDEDKMYLLRYLSTDMLHYEDLLISINILGRSYKDQVEQVKEVLLNYLTKNNI